jgi:hypothetical protein
MSNPMRNAVGKFLSLVALAALGNVSSPHAFEPVQHWSLRPPPSPIAEPVAQRTATQQQHRGTPYPHPHRFRGTPYPYRGPYPDYRRELYPPSTAAPMPRVPQVAPLAPRIGQ